MQAAFDAYRALQKLIDCLENEKYEIDREIQRLKAAQDLAGDWFDR